VTGTLLLFWDYDTQWGADRSRAGRGVRDYGDVEFPLTDRLLEVLAGYDVPACFAVVGSAALPGDRPYHDPDQIARIHERGHEVASHSHRHEWLPELGEVDLRETLVSSKAALETVLGGAEVTTFVPPFNQPFDFPARLAVSASERRACPRPRIGVRALCRALADTGYRFCRLSYEPLPAKVVGRLVRRRLLDRPTRLLEVEGVTTVRVNTVGGFDERSMAVVRQAADEGGIVVAWAHPHSLDAGNRQDEQHLVPFLDLATSLRAAGSLRIVRPRDLLDERAERVG
jgi:peptidoglycan/xylan/chitin deacetylase (PgdA/CDA1 family)